jgi:hypothetical protein
VGDVQPALLDSFGARAPPEVVDAMRQTVANMLGTLPPQARRDATGRPLQGEGARGRGAAAPARRHRRTHACTHPGFAPARR